MAELTRVRPRRGVSTSAAAAPSGVEARQRLSFWDGFPGSLRALALRSAHTGPQVRRGRRALQSKQPQSHPKPTPADTKGTNGAAAGGGQHDVYSFPMDDEVDVVDVEEEPEAAVEAVDQRLVLRCISAWAVPESCRSSKAAAAAAKDQQPELVPAPAPRGSAAAAPASPTLPSFLDESIPEVRQRKS